MPYLRSQGYSKRFIDFFLVPMAAAIWSAGPGKRGRVPAPDLRPILHEPRHPGGENPFEWKVIPGGSARYVEKLTVPYRDRIRLNDAGPVGHARHPTMWRYVLQGATERFDHVVMAIHSDQALEMLADPSPPNGRSSAPSRTRRTSRSCIRTVPSSRSAARSGRAGTTSSRRGNRRAALTYDMNILQTITAPVEFCVTLNRAGAIARGKKIGTYRLPSSHTTAGGPAAQQRHGEISGRNRTHTAGPTGAMGSMRTG